MTQGMEQGSGATLVAVRNGPGARLRAAREAKGWTELEVAQQLRLMQSMIERLEQDNYDTHTPLVFIKGYLRAYAVLVDLDPEQVLLEFSHLGIHDPVRDVPDLGQHSRISNFSAETPKARPGLLWGSLSLFVFIMLALMWTYRDQLPAMNVHTNMTSALPSSATSQSTEESELNAAIDAARKADAAQAAPAAAPAAGPAPGPGAAPVAPAPGTPAAAPAAATTPAVPTLKSTEPPVSRSGNNDDDGDEEEHVKPVSVNAVKVPAVKRRAPVSTHETMLF